MPKFDPGTIRGTPASEMVLPRDPLPPVRVGQPRRPVSRQPWQQVADGVAAMVEQYGQDVPSRARQAAKLALGVGNQTIRRSCQQIIQEGCDPARYVDYVVCVTRGRHKRLPQPQEVWGRKAVANWLGEYKRHAAGVGGRATYEASPARLAQYARAMRYDLLPAPRAAR